MRLGRNSQAIKKSPPVSSGDNFYVMKNFYIAGSAAGAGACACAGGAMPGLIASGKSSSSQYGGCTLNRSVRRVNRQAERLHALIGIVESH